MIDYGLLLSIILAFGVPSLLTRWWRPLGYDEPVGFIDVALGPAMAALAVGRLTTLALDDPSSIGSLSDMLIIRSGVEFWPGVLAAAAVVVWGERRARLPLLTRVAGLGPLAMVGYASYEAACVFRDGCYGPESPIGLTAAGLSTPMLPIGWFMAAGVALVAVGTRALVARHRPPAEAVAAGVLGVAAVRAVGSIWLPHVGDGLTRQHQTSLAVAAAAVVALGLGGLAVRRRTASSPAGVDGESTTGRRGA